MLLVRTPGQRQPINHFRGKIKSGTEELFVVILHPNPDTNTQIMKFNPIIIFILALSLYSLPSFGQSEKEPEGLGLPGDNLDLYAVLDIFQKSKTIEDFEKTLNDEKTAVNNLDLNLDNKVDFIKVVTEQEGDDFSFILQVPISEKETQDVAVILVSKDEKEKITMQIVGDKELYGENYIIEPQATTSPASTVNPGYTGDDPVTESTPATTKIVYVESAPIVKYVYSPVYVPYYPPYYYGYYPPYYNPFIVPIAFGVYWGNHYHYHGYGYGYGHTTVIINHNHYHNYNNHRNYSNTVYNNRTNGSYNKNVGKPRPSTGTSPSTRPSTGTSGTPRPSPGTSTRPSTGTTPSTRPSTGTKPTTKPSTGTTPSTRPSPTTKPSPTTRPSTTPSTRPSTTPSTRPATSPSTRPSTSPSTRPSSPSSMGPSRTMHSSGGYSGASRSSSSAPRTGGYSGGGGRRR